MTRQFIAQTENEQGLKVEEKIVFTLDASGNFRSLNGAGERLTGYTSEEARWMNVTDILSTQCAGEIREHVKRIVKNRFGTVFEIEIKAKDGRPVRLETSLALVRSFDGTIEFHGIALPQRDAAATGNGRPRCLDQRFAFESSVAGKRNVRVRLAR